MGVKRPSRNARLVAQAGLYRKFQESLRPGGMLFVGGTEIISQARDLGLQTSGIAFYQKA